jgi:sugar lactone lactonase YvrE
MVLIEARRLSSTKSWLGESPRWDALRMVLWWIDVGKTSKDGQTLGSLHRFDPITMKDETVLPCHGIGCVALGKDGTLLIGVDQEVRRWNPDIRVKPVTVGTLQADDGCVVNDCGCDAFGRLWLGTIRANQSEGGHLHCLEDGFGPRIMSMSMANGIGWSPDARTMYIVDSWEREVLAYDYNISTGTPTRTSEPVFVEQAHFTKSQPPFTEADPDGMCVDEDGGVWIAHNGTNYGNPRADGRVVRYADGHPDVTVVVPAVREVTACAFGGKNLSTLYVTTMRDDKNASLDGGAIFVATVGHRGVEPVEVAYPAVP